MSTTPISDNQGFWRLKALRFDTYQSMRTVAFCAAWQDAGGTIDGVVATGRYGRRTAYSRLRACRDAGFEPELVRFTARTKAAWAEEDKWQIAFIDKAYMEELVRRRAMPLPVRLLTRKPERYQDWMEED